MAEHAAPEYATAEGNDYVSHEGTYEGFLHFAFVGTLHVVCVVIALAIGGTTGSWFVAAGLIIFATVAAVQSILSKSRTSMYVMVVLSSLALALTAA